MPVLLTFYTLRKGFFMKLQKYSLCAALVGLGYALSNGSVQATAVTPEKEPIASEVAQEEPFVSDFYALLAKNKQEEEEANTIGVSLDQNREEYINWQKVVDSMPKQSAVMKAYSFMKALSPKFYKEGTLEKRWDEFFEKTETDPSFEIIDQGTIFKGIAKHFWGGWLQDYDEACAKAVIRHMLNRSSKDQVEKFALEHAKIVENCNTCGNYWGYEDFKTKEECSRAQEVAEMFEEYKNKHQE